MKLVIRNFRCYRGEHTFDLSSQTIFITGSSGAGKTSLLEAIIFSLYGKGKNMMSQGSSEIYSSDLIFDTFTIKRNKYNLIYQTENETISDTVAQEKIKSQFGRFLFVYSQTNSNLFLELAPKDQLEILEEILFRGEVDIKDIKGKFCAAKRALDSIHKNLLNQKSLTKEFLAKLGKVNEIGPVQDEKKRAELTRRRTFLQNRVSLHNQYINKVSELEKDIRELTAKISLYIKSSSYDSKYSIQELETHIRASESLEELNWKQFMGYSVEECTEELDVYEEDKNILERARHKRVICPKCSAALWYKDDALFILQENSDKVKAILEDIEADSIEEALDDINKQIRLYSNYKQKRQIIDTLIPKLLPISSPRKYITQLQEKEKFSGQIDALQGLLEVKKNHLAKLKAAGEQFAAHSWEQHRREIEDISILLQNQELYEMRKKEYAIQKEYETKLRILEEKVNTCSLRQSGLARASAILAETEQQYLSEMITSLSEEISLYIEEVFQTPFRVNMKIEAAQNGQRKLRIWFKEGYSYDMFSGGERAKLNICFLLAIAKFQNYKILFLDEFSRFLDKNSARRVFKMLRSHFTGKIIATEHDIVDLGVQYSQEIKLS